MAQSRSYTDAAGVAVNWSTAVVSGVAQVDIFEVVTEDQHSNRYTWVKASQPVDARKLAAAQYADAAAAANRALVGTLSSTLEVARPDGTALRYLPAGAASGTVRAVQNTGTASIRVAPTGTDTIDGGTASILVQPGEVGRFQSNGSGAWVHVVDLTSDALLKNTYGPGSDQWLKQCGAAFSFAFTSITSTDTGTGLPTAANIKWPDGTAGAFTATIDGGGNGYSGYTATWAGATTRTLTASGISYDSSGNPIGPTGLVVA